LSCHSRLHTHQLHVLITSRIDEIEKTLCNSYEWGGQKKKFFSLYGLRETLSNAEL